jgi:hypothetical protein
MTHLWLERSQVRDLLDLLKELEASIPLIAAGTLPMGYLLQETIRNRQLLEDTLADAGVG